MKLKTTIIIWIIIFTLLISSIVILDLINITQFIPLSNEYDWLAFIGSLIGGFFTFLSLFITIRYQKESDKETKRLENLPAFSVDYKMNNLENNKRHSIFTYDGNAIYSTAFPNDEKKLYPVIIIKLLSPSVAFDVHISDMYTIFNHNDLDKKYFYPGTYTLTNNKEYKCMLYFKDISEEIIGVFRISFSDILGNKYFQDVSFSYHDECISQYKFEIINVLRPHHINEINNCKIEDITKSEFNYLYNECNID